MPALSKVTVLDPDARAGRQVQLGFDREGIPTAVVPIPVELSALALPDPQTNLVIVGGSDGRALELVRHAHALLAAAHIDAPIVFVGRGVERATAEAAGAHELVQHPAYLRDVITIGRLLRSQPASQRHHIVGSLAETTGVFTLVRALSALGRSAVLTLIRGLRRGEVRFYRGEVTSAQVGLIHGQAALHQLLLWTDARFDYSHEDVVRRHQIPLSAEELFADAEQFLAGVRDSSGGLSPAMVLEQDIARVQTFGRQIPTEVHGVLRMFDGHRVLADVLEDSPYRVFETLRVAQRAVDAGLLRIASGPRAKATWRAVLAIEEWLVGSGPDPSPDTPSPDNAGSGPIPTATTGSESTPNFSSSRRKRKKRRANTPLAVTPTLKRTDIDWGALVPRMVAAEVGPLAGVVPAEAASGEIVLPTRDQSRERLEALTDTDKRDRIFPTDIGLEPSVVLEDGTASLTDEERTAPTPRSISETMAAAALEQDTAEALPLPLPMPEDYVRPEGQHSRRARTERDDRGLLAELTQEPGDRTERVERVEPDVTEQTPDLEARVQAEEAARVRGEQAALDARENAGQDARVQAEREPAEREQAEQEAREQAREQAQQERERTEQVARAQPEQEAREQAERERAELEARERAELEARERAELEARERAEHEARERAERERAEQQAREQAEREQPERERAEQQAREQAERERAEQPAREQPERERAEQQAREQTERERAEQVAREQAEREREQPAREQAERERAEQQAREQAERERAEQQAREQAERERAEQVAREQAERERAEQQAREQAERERTERERADGAQAEEVEREKVAASADQAAPASDGANDNSGRHGKRGKKNRAARRAEARAQAQAQARREAAQRPQATVAGAAGQGAGGSATDLVKQLVADVGVAPPAAAPASAAEANLAAVPVVTVDPSEELSDGVIREESVIDPPPLAVRFPPPGAPPPDDRPDDTTGEITTPIAREPARPPAVAEEPSILVTDVAIASAAVTTVAATTVSASAEPATPDVAAVARAMDAAIVVDQARRDATEVLSEIEEAFFSADEKARAAQQAQEPETFEDLDEGYQPVGFWDRLLGRKPVKPKRS